MTDITIDPKAIPRVSTLPDNAPVTYEMFDCSDPANPVLTDTVTLDTEGPDLIPDDPAWQLERGAALWRHSSRSLKLDDKFSFGPQLLVSHSGNTSSGSQPLQEVFFVIERGGDWLGAPFSEHYNKKAHTVFPRPFKIVAKDKDDNIIHIFQMHDDLAINDKTLHQGYPTREKPNRPWVTLGMALVWWNEPPRLSASVASMFSGLIDEAMRPSTAKSHFSVNGCEPPITGGYSGYSLNSLGSIWVSKEWPQPYGAYWPAPGKGDPWINYADLCYEGKSATMGPFIEGYLYEPGARIGHTWYRAPGGPRFDRSAFQSVLALFATRPDGKRPDGVLFSTLAYNSALGYANFPNKWVTNAADAFFISDVDALESRKGYTGNYYGDGRKDGPDSIRLNSDQRDGTNAWHFDGDGNMPYHGAGVDSLHDHNSAGEAAIVMQSFMMMALAKWDTITSFMVHGHANQSGRGHDNDCGSYMVRDMAWRWKHHVIAWKIAGNHPLNFKRKDIEDRFVVHLEAIHREIVTPILNGERPPGAWHWFEGIVRFGQPVFKENGNWLVKGGGLGLYLGGVLIYMKQSGMYDAIQKRGGKAYEALLFTIRNACQFAFGVFSQTKATMWSNPGYPQGMVFADGSDMPRDWKEWSERMERSGEDFNGNPNGSCRGGDRDVSVHPVIQFIYAMQYFFPEIDHPWKKAAWEQLNIYLDRQTAYVKSFEGDPGRQRDADHIFRYPGLAPLKAPDQVGPGDPVELPKLEDIPLKNPPKIEPPPTLTPLPTDHDWQALGWEGDNLTVPDNTQVAYGIDANWVVKTISGQFTATNDFFRNDPAPGIRKQVMSATQPIATPTEKPADSGAWEVIGREYNTIPAQPAGTKLRYGLGGKYVYVDAPEGEFYASNGYFGSDPFPGETKNVERLIPAATQPEKPQTTDSSTQPTSDPGSDAPTISPEFAETDASGTSPAPAPTTQTETTQPTPQPAAPSQDVIAVSDPVQESPATPQAPSNQPVGQTGPGEEGTGTQPVQDEKDPQSSAPPVGGIDLLIKMMIAAADAAGYTVTITKK